MSQKFKGKTNLEIVQSYLNGERPFLQFGYTPKPPPTQRKLGEQWTDVHGITWEQKNGFKVQINKQADLIRQASSQKCKCGQNIQYGNRLDNKFFIKTGKCFDCIIKEETEYRVLGVYGFYEQFKLLSNYLGYLKDLKQKINDSIRYFQSEDDTLQVLCNSEGYLEKFQGLNTTQLLENAKKDLEEVTQSISIVSKDKQKAKKAFTSELSKARKEAKKLLKH